MKYFLPFFFLLVSTYAGAQQRDQSAGELIQRAIQNRSDNDPRKRLDTYGYLVYEKTVITDSVQETPHDYLSEKVSSIVFSEEDDFTERVIGFQLAGFDTPRYEVLAIDLQSRSFYDEDFVIFNNRYAGILSKRGLKNYNYRIEDTTVINGRPSIALAFAPKRPKTVPGLSGALYLDQETLAIQRVNISLVDELIIQLDQSYNYLATQNIYLPKERNLQISKGTNAQRLSFFGGRISIGTVSGEVLEDMVRKNQLNSTTRYQDYTLGKEALTTPFLTGAKAAEPAEKPITTITVLEGAANQPESFWQEYRTEALSEKDKRSFRAIEKIVKAENIERRLGRIDNFSIGYFSLNFFDADLTYPVKFNNYEGLRLGFGGVTNALFSERIRLEGYAAYGFKDQEFKYGGGGGYLLDPDRGVWWSASFNKDLEEVGSYAYLTDRRVYSLFEPRLVNINLFYKHRTLRTNLEYRLTPKVLTEFQLAHRRIEQTTPYRFVLDNQEYSDYDITEATFGLRWSPRSKFLKSPAGLTEIQNQYPIVTAQLSQGFDGLGGSFNYTKLGAKAFYRLDRLNKSATEILVEGNLGFGELPLSHLFHAYPNAPTKETILQRFSVAGVNSFETMFFGEFFSDQLFMAQIKHRLRPFDLGEKFKPEMVLITRYALGDVSNQERHQDISFNSLRYGYTESGFEINKLFFGFGTSLTYRYGAYHLPDFEDNIALKFTFYLAL
ncbi:DUF5686 family protein [Croceiramulus getboli]|nr:DUF5686 family protein [Flavobacteriaceae bacterium YJPT1-3]